MKMQDHPMTMNPPNGETPWRFLDHTADIRMEVRGSTLEELFVNAGRGLGSLLPWGFPDDSPQSLAVDLEAGDREELLVAWLREILYQHETTGFSFGGARIREFSDTRIAADLHSGVPGRESESELEIKAVTYHGLSIEETDQGLVARIVFDI